MFYPGPGGFKTRPDGTTRRNDATQRNETTRHIESMR
jgi:hypothetical protein